VVDERALVGLVPDDLRITLILVRRVDGVPHYRYLSNGRHEEIFQPWSSTKFIAIAQAGSTLRQVSEGRVGLTGSVDGVPIGDLASIVHSYEESRFTSNGLSRWFLNVGGRSAVSSSLYDWLQRPRTESLGGNYGHPTPELGYRVEDEDQWIEVEAVDRNGPKNALSTRTLAEGLKRLVMHREDPSTAMPYLQWDDVATLLYGAELSSMYSDGTPQGMEADTTVYLQQAIDVDAMEERSRGMWRIFGKLGFGYSRGGEYVHTGYACLPSIDEDGTPKLDHGKEFFVAVQLGADQKYHQTDDRIAGIYRTLTAGILDGTIK
jgi:hypothetical protein